MSTAAVGMHAEIGGRCSSFHGLRSRVPAVSQTPRRAPPRIPASQASRAPSLAEATSSQSPRQRWPVTARSVRARTARRGAHAIAVHGVTRPTRPRPTDSAGATDRRAARRTREPLPSPRRTQTRARKNAGARKQWRPALALGMDQARARRLSCVSRAGAPREP